MAILDPRMLDLIETLTAVNMDWLAFELVEAIQTGLTHSETRDTLAATRKNVREDNQPKATGEPRLISQEPHPITGSDQIEWASKYVEERIETTLAYLMQSIETLDTITQGSVRPPDTQTGTPGETLVVLADGESQRKAGRPEVETAIALLPQLRHALGTWSAQVRNEIRG